MPIQDYDARKVAAKLHTVAVISNPRRYDSRYTHYFDFAARMAREPDVELYTVELQLRDRPFVVTEAGNPKHLQLRSSYEVWHKENMFNVGVERLLPDDADYIAFPDADIQFTNPRWAAETIHELQHHPVVQMFSHAIDLGPEGESILQREGFAWAYRQGKDMLPPSRQMGEYKSGNFHPGYAWAYRRNFLDEAGGLIERAIVGSADYHMAYAMIGRGDETAPRNISGAYQKMILGWQDRCERSMRGNLGYVDGTITHAWHGKKVDRRYADRWKILFDNEYDPETDVIRDSHGILRLSGNKPKLRFDLQQYFLSRNEESIDKE